MQFDANDATEGGNSTPGARSPVRGPAVWAVDGWTHWLVVGQCLWLWPWLLAVSRGAFPGRGREKRHC